MENIVLYIGIFAATGIICAGVMKLKAKNRKQNPNKFQKLEDLK